MFKRISVLALSVIVAGTFTFLPVLAGELGIPEEAPVVTGDYARLMSSPETDEWLSDWEYEIKDRGLDGDYIHLEKYIGSETDISIGGKATVNGVDYPVCIAQKSGGGYGHYITGLNSNKNLKQITFYSVDGTPVCPAINYRLDDLFYGMENLEGINFGDDFETGSVTQAPAMFYGCESLKYVDIDNLDLNKCSMYKEMFEGCESLNRITLNCSRPSNFKEMFKGCKGLTEVTINGDGESETNLKYADHMFSGCSSLEAVKISGIDFSGVKDFSFMFSDCDALKDIDMAMFNMSGATSIKNMFQSCSGLKEIDLSKVEWGEAKPDADSMFLHCGNLEKIKVSENFKPSYAGSIFHQGDYKGKPITIEGRRSKEFDEKVFPTLKESNRYLGYVQLRSKIELEGQELKDGMFGVSQVNDREVVYGINNTENDNIIEINAKVYEPGSNTFTVEEVYAPEGGEDYVFSRSISDVDEYECAEAVRSRTVNIILNTDGSLSVEE